MRTRFLTEAPGNAKKRLNALEGSELFFLFRSLSWRDFLKPWIATLSPDVSKALLHKPTDALKKQCGVSVSAIINYDEAGSIVDGLLDLYLAQVMPDRSILEEVQDIFRVQSAKDDVGDFRALLAAVLDAKQLQDSDQRALLPIAKALSDVGQNCEEEKTSRGNASSCYTPKIRPREAYKRLMAFRTANVPITTVAGFKGRAFAEEADGRARLFQATWSAEALSLLDAPEARELCGILSSGTVLTSPSAATFKRQLLTLLGKNGAAAVKLSGQYPVGKRTVEARPIKDTHSRALDPTMPGKAGRRLTGSETGGIREKSDIREIGLRHPVRFAQLTALGAPLVQDKGGSDRSDSSFSTSSSSRSSENSSASVRRRRNRSKRSRRKREYGGPDSSRVPFFCHLPAYRALPKAIRKILRRGGPSFWSLFEPLALEITTARDLTKLRRYHNKVHQVAAQVFRAKGLGESPKDCEDKLEVWTIRRIRPNERINQGVSFPPTTWIAPRELACWLQHGELKTWLSATVAQAGPLHADSQEGHLAREILSSCLVLAALMDEFHPSNLLQSVAVERLVRRLVVYEKALTLEKKNRGAYRIKQLEFMGLGGGVTETESALGN